MAEFLSWIGRHHLEEWDRKQKMFFPKRTLKNFLKNTASPLTKEIISAGAQHYGIIFRKK